MGVAASLDARIRLFGGRGRDPRRRRETAGDGGRQRETACESAGERNGGNDRAHL